MVLKFFYVYLLIMIAFSKLGACQRRIFQGRFSPEGKRYVVYLLNSNYSESQPLSWLCGGAIIKVSHVLTSAACLTEVSHIYVIAGYKKYVSAEDINKDECTRRKKNRIVATIVPQDFHLDAWTKFDVGIAIVEKPFDFYDYTYNVICSYAPGSIMINFDPTYEPENLNTVVFGWGGNKPREPGRLHDINVRYMKEARTILANPSFCQTRMNQPMESYYLCAYGAGFMTSDGRDVKPIDLYENCGRRFILDEDTGTECVPEEDIVGARRHENHTGTNMIDEQPTNNNNKSEYNNTDARKQLFRQEPGSGICENDHGGPLVTWVGKTELIIGIALNGVYDVNYDCQGPFLYTSTAKSKDLLLCLLNTEDDAKRRACNMNHIRTEITEIQWPDHINNKTNKPIKRNKEIFNKEEQIKPEHLLGSKPILRANVGAD